MYQVCIMKVDLNESGYEKINATIQSRMEEFIQKGNDLVQQQPLGKKYYEIKSYYVYDQYTSICFFEKFRDKGEE